MPQFSHRRFSDLLWLGPQNPQTCEDVVCCIQNVMVHLHLAVGIKGVVQKVICQAKADQNLQHCEMFVNQTMLLGPYGDDPLSCNKLQSMTEVRTSSAGGQRVFPQSLPIVLVRNSIFVACPCSFEPPRGLWLVPDPLATLWNCRHRPHRPP